MRHFLGDKNMLEFVNDSISVCEWMSNRAASEASVLGYDVQEETLYWGVVAASREREREWNNGGLMWGMVRGGGGSRGCYKSLKDGSWRVFQTARDPQGES